ncbi:MAG: cupin domain-containing protein [Chloroflexota bacterium]
MSETAYTFFENILTSIPEITPDTIISKTFYSDDQVKVILFGFAPGQELSEHTASKPAILHFLSGKARLTLGEDSFLAAEGAWVHMPPHLPHSILAETPVTMLLILLEKGAA